MSRLRRIALVAVIVGATSAASVFAADPYAYATQKAWAYGYQARTGRAYPAVRSTTVPRVYVGYSSAPMVVSTPRRVTYSPAYRQVAPAASPSSGAPVSAPNPMVDPCTCR